jgi:hypothetical protein
MTKAMLKRLTSGGVRLERCKTYDHCYNKFDRCWIMRGIGGGMLTLLWESDILTNDYDE